MGLRGFYTFINSIEGSWRTVNILEELEKHRIMYDRDPVVIINLWTISNHFYQSIKDKLFGCRLSEMRSEFENFLISLRNIGVELIFVFKKSQCKELDFAETCETQYEKGCEVLDAIKALESTKYIEGYFGIDPTFPFPHIQTVAMVVAQTAKNYGTIYGMDSVDCIPSTLHMQLALKNNATAIIGLDTYYFFHQSSFKLWSDAELNMKTMTLREYNKDVILDHLGISVEKSPLFVALAGGLYSSIKNVNKLANFFESRKRDFFKRVASYVNNLSFPFTSQTLSSIVRDIFGRNDPTIEDDILRTMGLMNTQVENKIRSKYDQEMMKVSDNEFLSFANQILKNEPIGIPVNYMDLRINDMAPIKNLVAPWIQKTAGILLKYQDDDGPRTIIVKSRHEKPAEAVKIAPIFPSFYVPALNDLITSKLTDADATEIMRWICHLDSLSTTLYDYIPDEHLCVFVILIHAIEQKSLLEFEAELILQTVVDVSSGKVPNDIEYPENVSARALRVSFLFSKLFFVLHSCLASVGLQRYQTDFHFDNVHFQKLYEGKKDKASSNSKNIFYRLTKIIFSSMKSEAACALP